MSLHRLCNLKDLHGKLDAELFHPFGIDHNRQILLPEDGSVSGLTPSLRIFAACRPE